MKNIHKRQNQRKQRNSKSNHSYELIKKCFNIKNQKNVNDSDSTKPQIKNINDINNNNEGIMVNRYRVLMALLCIFSS